MFVKNGNLVFIKSLNVNAFPCGRRRAELVDKNNDGKVAGYIPFDPEARLNTEANQRKYSSLNGYKQSYLSSWDTNSIQFVLGGYWFSLDTMLPTEFGDSVEQILEIGNIDKIYANIRLADVELFNGGGIGMVGTPVLRDQADTQTPSTSIDFLIDDNTLDKNDSGNYYFAGLSFSAKELTNNDFKDTSEVISKQILVKVDNSWQIYNPFRLPSIDHGESKDSVVVNGDLAIKAAGEAKGKLTVDGDLKVFGDINTDNNINAAKITAEVYKFKNNKGYAPALNVVQNSSTGEWQLQFTIPTEEDN